MQIKIKACRDKKFIPSIRLMQGNCAFGRAEALRAFLVLIGEGIPLFGSLEKDVKLRQIDTRKYGAGMVQSEYAVAR